MAKFDLKEYARRGAEARLAELTQELEAIYGTFPELRRRPGRSASFPLADRTSDAPGRRRRKPMTAAQKKAVGERMKKYWAARKAGAAKK